jgi:hypothetical protein
VSGHDVRVMARVGVEERLPDGKGGLSSGILI